MARVLLRAVLAALLLLGASNAMAQSRAGPGQLVGGMLTVEGTARQYLVYVPSGYRPGVPLPLVFGFHGGGGFATDMALGSGLSREAEPANFIAVYPQGIEETWNTEETDGSFVERSHADDVAFIRAILARLAPLYAIDPRRIFAVGFSKGGMFAYHAGCRMPDVFAAVVSVSGPMVANVCAPAAAQSVLHIHGTEDENAPFNGGRGLFTDPSNQWPPAMAGLSAYGAADRCEGAATPVASLYGTWNCSEFAHCANGAEVRWCLITNGAHEWPPAASVAIAAFLKQHAKP